MKLESLIKAAEAAVALLMVGGALSAVGCAQAAPRHSTPFGLAVYSSSGRPAIIRLLAAAAEGVT